MTSREESSDFSVGVNPADVIALMAQQIGEQARAIAIWQARASSAERQLAAARESRSAESS